MSKSNPTTRPDAPDYEVVGIMIHRYEPMTIAEAFGVLSQAKNPLCGFRDADFQPWVKGNLYYVHPGGAKPFRTRTEMFRLCGRITAEDPRKVPESVPELPVPWLAYVGKGARLPICRSLPGSGFPYWINWTDENHWENGVDGSHTSHCHAIDVRTAFAREHFPEYVQALGYPMEEPEKEPSDPFEEWVSEETNFAGKHMRITRLAFIAGRDYERGLK